MARKNGKDRGILQRKGRDGWWVRFIHNGRERWHKCDTKSQAKALYGRLKADQREGKYFKKERPLPFRQLAKEYEETVDANRRGRVGDDKSRIQKWVDAFGDQDARTLTLSQIRGVLSSLRQDKKKPATIHRHLTVLKAILNHAEEGLETLLVKIRKKVKQPEYNNELIRCLTPDQETALLEKLPKRFHPIVLFATHTGLRQGELLRLRWLDVNEQTGMVSVEKTKSGMPRFVPLNSLVQRTLLELRAQHAPQPNDRIFPHDARYLRRAFDKAVGEAGLAPFRFHDLRHTFASRLAMQGCNDRTLMELGGWKSPLMLKRYAHLGPSHLWKAVEGLTQTGTVTKTVTEEITMEEEARKLLKNMVSRERLERSALALKGRCSTN